MYIVEGEISKAYNHPIDAVFNHLTYNVYGSEYGSNGYKSIICKEAYSNRLWIKTQRYDSWLSWELVSLAKPPQEFDLPLTEGWSAHRKSEYFKTQDGVVTVYFQVHSTTPVQANTEVVLGALPEGFRPANPVGGTGYAQLNTGAYIVSDMKVYANGDITGYQKQGEATYFTGFFTFVAAS